MTFEEMVRQGWHPPMAMPMPNTPRDPSIELKKKRALEAQLRAQKAGVSPIPSSQNPFAERVPSSDEMAMTSAALRYAQAPAEPSANIPERPDQEETPLFDEPEPVPTLERPNGSSQAIDRPSDLPGTADNPKMPGPMDAESWPGEAALKSALMSKATSPQASRGPMTYSPEYLEALKNASSSNRNLGLMGLMARSANQMGSINGKIADSSGVENYLSSIGKSDGMKELGALEALRLKQTSLKEDPQTKLLLDLYKFGQDRSIADQTNQTRKEYNEAIAGIRANPPEKNFSPLEEELMRGKVRMQEKELAAPPKPADMPIEDKELISATSKDLGKATNAISAYRGWLAGFDDAQTEAEKIAYARMNLKDLQSTEFGPDAINAHDEPRLTGYLDQFRPMDALRDGGQVFKPQLDKFRTEIVRKMMKAETRVRAAQDNINQVKSSGALNLKPKTDSKAPKDDKIKVTIPSASAGKVMVRDADGTVYEIDPEDLEEALRSGAKKI